MSAEESDESTTNDSSVKGSSVFSSLTGVTTVIASKVIVLCGAPVFSPKVDRAVLPLLEISKFLMFALFCLDGLGYGYVGWFTRVLTLPVFPLQFATTLLSFSIGFVIVSVFVVLGILALGYHVIFQSLNSDSFMIRALSIFLKLNSTLLLIPLIATMLSPLRCDVFEATSFVVYQLRDDGLKVYDFPVFLFAIYGAVGALFILCSTTIDSLLLLGKFRVGSSVREIACCSPDGRFQFLFGLVQIACVTCKVLCPTSYGFVSEIITFALSAICLVAWVRFSPYFAAWMNALAVALLSISTALSFDAIFIKVLQTYYAYAGLAIALPITVTSLTMYFTRYTILRRIIKRSVKCPRVSDKDGTVSNSMGRAGIMHYLFIKSGAFDLCIMLSMVRDDGLRTNEIMKILTNTKISKTKEMCHMLLSLTLHNPGICSELLSHTRSISKATWIQHELALSFYRDKVLQMRASRGGGGGHADGFSRDVKVMKQLTQLRKREELLRELYQFVLGSQLSNIKEGGDSDGIGEGRGRGRKEHNPFANYSQAYSEISKHRGYCKTTYVKLLENHTSPETLRQYAAFASLFLNDTDLAKRCNQEASQIDRIPGSINTRARAGVVARKGKREKTKKKRKKGKNGDKSIMNNSRSNERITHDSYRNRGGGDGEEEMDYNSSISSTEGVVDGSMLSSEDGEVTHSPHPSPIVFDSSDDDKEWERDGNKREGSTSDHTATDMGTDFDGGSLISLISSNTTKSLRKKFASIRVWPAVFIRIGVILVCFALIGIFTASFTLSIIMKERFDQSANNIDLTARIRIRSVSSAHFLRKLQISAYAYPMTVFNDERNTSSFRERSERACRELIAFATRIYRDVPAIDYAWRDEILNLYERRDLNFSSEELFNQNKSSYEFLMQRYSLIDSVVEFGERCLKFLELNDSSFGSRAVGGRPEDDSNFVFVTLNEPPIYVGLQNVLKEFLAGESDFADTMKYTLIGLPFLMLVFIPYFAIMFVWFFCAERRSMKGIQLVRRDHLLNLYTRFGGKVANIGNSRVQLPRFSTGVTFVGSVFVYIVACVLLLGVFSVIGTISSDSFNQRNLEFDHTCLLKIHTHRVHLWAVELLYRDDTLFTDEEIVSGLENEVNELQTIFEDLRFGDESEGLTGNDMSSYGFPHYYEQPCSSNGLNISTETFDYLKCQTITRQIYILIEASKILLQRNLSDSAAKGSLEYREIIELDNNVNDRGALQDEINDLRDGIQESFDTTLDLLVNSSILLIVVVMPALLLFIILFFWKSSGKLAMDILQTKEILLLLPSKVLMEKNIYDYMRGRETNFRNLFQNKKRAESHQLIDIFQKSSYAVIWFDKKCRILSFNDQADDLLNIRESPSLNLKSFMTADAFGKITGWMRNKFNENRNCSLNAEIRAVYNQEEEFGILINVMRDEDCFVAILENVENSKKKKILEEAEKMNEESERLLANILPEGVIRQMKGSNLNNIVSSHKSVTAWFADICDFTGWSRTVSPEKVVGVLNKFFSGIDDISKRNRVEKIKTIGDCYFGVCGVPRYIPKHATIAVNNAVEVMAFIPLFNRANQCNFVMRMGLSSGNVVSGVIGKWKFCYDVWGAVINLAARCEATAPVGKIQVSRELYELVFDEYNFMERRVDFQGIGRVNVYVYVSVRKKNAETKIDTTIEVFEDEGVNPGDDDVKDSLEYADQEREVMGKPDGDKDQDQEKETIGKPGEDKDKDQEKETTEKPDEDKDQEKETMDKAEEGQDQEKEAVGKVEEDQAKEEVKEAVEKAEEDQDQEEVTMNLVEDTEVEDYKSRPRNFSD